jgi:hypothetical protein
LPGKNGTGCHVGKPVADLASTGLLRVECTDIRLLGGIATSMKSPVAMIGSIRPIRSVRYTERLTKAGIERSVGSVGDALAETINGL